MQKTCHILNGDSLANHVSALELENPIIFREALMDGTLQVNTMEELINSRRGYFNKQYPNLNLPDYEDYAAKELLKIDQIQNESSIYLWFEYDLFCQINFWFLIMVLHAKKLNYKLFWVTPSNDSPYNFLNSNPSLLLKKAQNWSNLSEFSFIWDAFANKDYSTIKSIVEKANAYSHLKTTLNHLITIHHFQSLDDLLIERIHDVKREFAPLTGAEIFKQFSSRYPEIGITDIHFLRLFNLS